MSDPTRDRAPADLLAGLPLLPVAEVVPDVVSALADHGRAVLQAPPGAGKTTLVPIALHRAGLLDGRVVVLEPRRIAARAAASRMAALVGEELGGLVGCTTREDRATSARTRIEVVTEGVLVRRLQADPTAEGIAAVVLDEFHERAVVADLALAFALECRAAVREDLRILVMSATLQGARVGGLLGAGTPMVTSAGREHEVRTRHRPVPVDADVGVAVADAVRAVLDEAVGDVLAFLPGQREIGRAQRAMDGLAGVDVVPLYGALPPARQQQALEPAPSGRRRVVLATDIAESSLTVPGVRIVVDAGWARRPRFDPTTGMSRLVTTRVSRASADQRRGRAAREGPGVCLRLWPEHEALVEHAPPSIAEEDLAPVALEVAAWGTPVEELPLLDQPPAATWAAALDLLGGLGALGEEGRLTDHGRAMAALPVHPRLAHMALRAEPAQRRLAAEVAALLGERDVLLGGGADLERRVQALRGGGGTADGQVRRGALARVRREADRLHRRLGGGDGAPVTDTGTLLALAYPDRIARRRERRGVFVMAGGRGATLPESDVLAGERLLAVAHVDGGGTDARIFLAAALDEDAVASLVTVAEVVGWADGDVVAQRQRRLGAFVLSASPLADPPVQAVQAALVEGVRTEGLGLLGWSGGARALRDRLRHLHAGRAEEGWPPVDEETLLAELEEWLVPFLGRARRAGDLARVDLHTALMSRVPWHLHGVLDEVAPTHLEVPSGSRVRVDYAGERPVLAVKLQEMFGAVETPRIAGAPVLLHLLSPAGRPVQVTDDIAGFWTRAYPEVRAELRGRYAKHPWPEDPLSAEPTARTKGRRR